MVIPISDVEKTRIVPVATYLLIVINILVYVVQQTRPATFTVAYAATPYEITHNVDLDGIDLLQVADKNDPEAAPRRLELKQVGIDQAHARIPVWLTLFTAMFLHGSPLHIFGNMLYLWIFGDNVEEVLGTWGYLLLYLGSGLVGSLAQILASPNSIIPTLGASGAIAGVMGAYVVWFPRNRVRVLAFPYMLIMPALLVIGGWILIQVWVSETSWRHMGEQGGVAYLAHVGGALTGMLVALAFRRRAREVQWRNENQGWTEPGVDLPPE